MPVHYQIGGKSAAEIAASVEAGVRDGDLVADALLPAVRTLAGQLAVAPATVAAAYRTLRDRGVVETAGRNGTRIRRRPPVAARGARTPVPSGVVDLASGVPDSRLLPVLGPRLRRLAAEASAPVGYGAGPVTEFLDVARERLATDGVPVAGDGVGLTVTSGALDAIERLLSAHLRPGDRVGIEDPGWANLIDLVAALGLQAVPMPVDDDGPTVDGLRRAIASGVSVVVVTSRAQNPTGAAVSPERAAALRAILAEAPSCLTIEDDHAAELATVPLAPLAGAGQRWAFVRSLSKPYGPDLRVAVVAGDETSVARVEGRMRLGAGWVSTLLQRLVVYLWEDESVTASVARAREVYAGRRQSMLSALSARGVSAHGRSGINVWVPVADEADAVGTLRDHGWAVAPGSHHRLASGPGIRITVSTLAESDVERLAELVSGAAVRDVGGASQR